jgi:antitoxin component YwqK of YwqJK toxin-antitoxin module
MRFRLRTLLIAVTIACGFLAIWRAWDFIPGTFHVDESGFAHGTGTEYRYYKAGALKSKMHYFGGTPTNATWYKPDGSVVGTAAFDKESVSTGYQLREDGSIRSTAQYRWSDTKRLHVGHGQAVYFNEDGSVEKVLQYVDGVEHK